MQGFAPADESLLFRQKEPKPFSPVRGPLGVPPPPHRIRWLRNSLRGARPPLRSNSLRQEVDSALQLRRAQGIGLREILEKTNHCNLRLPLLISKSSLPFLNNHCFRPGASEVLIILAAAFWVRITWVAKLAPVSAEVPDNKVRIKKSKTLCLTHCCASRLQSRSTL